MFTENLDLPYAWQVSEGREFPVSQAKNGDREAMGQLLEASRDYLREVAGANLAEDVRAKLSVSDLVQDTLFDAQQSFDQFQGTSAGELLAWLRKILINNLLNHYRKYRATQKRCLARETALANAGTRLVYAEDETPSEVCMRQEEASLLTQALAELPEDHQQVIRLRHREGLSFPEIGERMDRSADAARMLWYRAFDRLSSEIEQLTR
jgi:RNA polymerase sigma-70 factor (ECF subfamily)